MDHFPGCSRIAGLNPLGTAEIAKNQLAIASAIRDSLRRPTAAELAALPESSLDHRPANGKWEFDAAVTGCFEDMLRRSIPQYDVMRKAVTDLVVNYATNGTTIVDLGTSRGDALVPILEHLGIRNRYLGVEISKPMAEAARETLAPWIRMGICAVQELDLRTSYPTRANVSVVLSVLSLQFTPIEYRQRIVQDVYNSLQPGGGIHPG